MSRHPILVTAVTASLLLALSIPFARAQEPAPKTPPPRRHEPASPTDEGSGVADRIGSFLVGDQAPDVDLNDTRGVRFHLAEERRVRPWLLVFARRPGDLDEARKALPGLAALNVGTVAIAPFHDERALPDEGELRLLFDRASYVARTYGQIDPVTTNPRAGAFLVDVDGRMILIISGGFPSGPDLVRMSSEALESAHMPRK